FFMSSEHFMMVLLGVLRRKAKLVPTKNRWAATRMRGPSVSDPSVNRCHPVVGLALRLVLHQAVPLLKLSDEDFALAGDRFEIVVGELAPLGAQLTFDLMPTSAELIPGHRLVRVERPPRRFRDVADFFTARRAPTVLPALPRRGFVVRVPRAVVVRGIS